MALKEQITNDLKAALLGGDRFVAETLRGLKAAILNEEVAAGKRDAGLSDDEIEKVVAKEVKKRNESANLYRQNSRDDLAEPEEKEAEVLKQYLPAQLSEDEIIAMVQRSIESLGASGTQAMGQVIASIKKEAGNTVDGAVLAKIVKQALNK
jgi:uncharacterized protein YqeY